MKKIKVMGYRQACAYTPTVPTLMMRIYDYGIEALNSPQNKLLPSTLYITTEYTFDDLDMDSIENNYGNKKAKEIKNRLHPFTPSHAQTILSDIKKNINSVEEIIIHCTHGASRSPAVAIALAEIHPFEQNDYYLKKLYPSYNRYVYRLLQQAEEEPYQ